MRFGIALYYYGLNADPSHPTPYFHWAFLSSDLPWSKNDTTCYEIVRQDDYLWKWHFTRPNLAKSARFRGIVELGEFQGSTRLIDDIIRASHPASVKEWTVIGPRGWTCATWVMKLAIDLEERGYYDFPDGVSVHNLYKTVLEKGALLRDLKGLTLIPVLPLVSLVRAIWPY
ncbi:uncharacterized protein BT62DRAFT_893830 [Guyanagaster necrorhizus]|uniref:Uncharacterized protein n=1 Tax=Guyanagaster necrorhizus TaxID=856835 RepID=A0A9P8AT26_9AGAR|nr:uncharacterized protein BT62DRAFT_893830 [Guyanagaster necrorhizus MCA 3950]KAG7447003.1 hypothetical protein BT62DRAFT_893830 [Guyanagaster necrorhizus MCA 3950]